MKKPKGTHRIHHGYGVQTLFGLMGSVTFALLFPLKSYAKVNLIEVTQKTAEQQIHHLLDPLLEKYCHDECKLMSASVTVDLAKSTALSPGFDDTDTGKGGDLAPSSAVAKILMNDKIGPVSKEKLLELVQQYLDTLDYPVKIETQIAHFPMPQGSEGKIAEMREKISKQFQSITDDLLRQFCPQSCILADFNLQTQVVNGEEAQYGPPGEFVQDGDTAIKVKSISATILMDESLSPEEQTNIVEMAKLKSGAFKNVDITGKSMKFPHPLLAGSGHGYRGLASDTLNSSNENRSTDSKNTSDSKSLTDSKNVTNNTTTTGNNETNNKEEKYSRIEKIERVENGDAVQAELQKFKIFGIIFSASVLALLIFIAMSTYQSGNRNSSVHRIIQDLTSDSGSYAGSPSTKSSPSSTPEDKISDLSMRYEIERLHEELLSIYAQQPRVAKQVFSRVLTEEGVEATAECVHIFGEGIVVDMLRDPSLQTDIAELMEYYAKNPIELKDEDKLDLLRKLHSRTVSGKLAVLGNRSSNLFDFLAEMDGLQILELIRTESMTVKSIVLTQCDAQKRAVVYAQMDPDLRIKILAELSRIDYLPKDFIFNVANALKRKRRDNPRLNTEALPGSEVLVSLLERTGQAMQKTVIKNLEAINPESARTVKNKLVSVDTLKYLRDGQLLEVVLSLKHDELIQFLKGTSDDVRKVIFAKSPKDLVVELEEELELVKALSKEVYQAVERKVLNRMKVMANDAQINLIETNERMFSEVPSDLAFMNTTPGNNRKQENAS